MAVLITGFKVEKKIKDGGFSSVYKGRRISDGQTVALKVLSVAGKKDGRAYQMFRNEARILLALDHPYIVKALEYVTDATRPTICMVYFESENLKSRLRARSKIIKRKFIKIFSTVCEALQYLHEKNIVHRDIKPENILVHEEGETRLIDFSLAETQQTGLFGKLFGGSRKVQGTPLYMSPEQIRKKPLDIRSDIYSLGCTIYEVMVDQPPFRAQTAQELLRKHLGEAPIPPKRKDKDIPDDLNELVLRMLAKRPDKRPQTPAEILEILAAYEV